MRYHGGSRALFTRFIRGVSKIAMAMSLVILLTLRGTPTVYYGDELGMNNVVIPTRTHPGSTGEKCPRFRLRPRSITHSYAMGCRSPCWVLPPQRRALAPGGCRLPAGQCGSGARGTVFDAETHS